MFQSQHLGNSGVIRGCLLPGWALSFLTVLPVDHLPQNHLSTIADPRNHNLGPQPGNLRFAKFSVLLLHSLKFEIYQVTKRRLGFTNTVTG